MLRKWFLSYGISDPDEWGYDRAGSLVGFIIPVPADDLVRVFSDSYPQHRKAVVDVFRLRVKTATSRYNSVGSATSSICGFCPGAGRDKIFHGPGPTNSSRGTL